MAESPYKIAIKIDDTGFERKLKNIQNALKKKVRVGILHAETYENGSTTADVASWNEIEGNGETVDVKAQETFNHGTPKRSVIKVPLKLYEKEIYEAGKDVIKKEGLSSQSIKNALNAVGETARDAIIAAFDNSADGNWAENKPSTIKRKGSDKPMIHTGTLASNIEWEVVNGE